jgi:hypothetical protein
VSGGLCFNSFRRDAEDFQVRIARLKSSGFHESPLRSLHEPMRCDPAPGMVFAASMSGDPSQPAPGCHPCHRNVPLPMCPGRTRLGLFQLPKNPLHSIRKDPQKSRSPARGGASTASCEGLQSPGHMTAPGGVLDADHLSVRAADTRNVAIILDLSRNQRCLVSPDRPNPLRTQLFTTFICSAESVSIR